MSKNKFEVNILTQKDRTENQNPTRNRKEREEGKIKIITLTFNS